MKVKHLALGLALAAAFACEAQTPFRFPMPEFESGYQHPEMNLPPNADTSPVLDIFLLTAGMSITAWALLKRRSRNMIFVISVVSLLYFGFYRKGCVCPVGSIQNMLAAGIDHSFQMPYVVVAFFLLPLLFALYFGRVFCAAVCPLGAAQEMCAVYPIQVPRAVENVLTLIPYGYLGLVVLAMFTGSGYLICRYDPFVGFFRLGASFNMLLFGGSVLLLGLFIGRPYCRYLCPYGVLLRWTSKFSKWHASITPAECTQCRLCESACPYGAIEVPVPLESIPDKRIEIRRLAILLALTPIIIAIMAGAGFAASDVMARLHPTVRLAEWVAAEEQGQISAHTVETDAFRAGKNSPDELYSGAEAIRRRFERGAAVFGGFMGLVLCGRLIRLSRIRRSADYVAHRGACLGCARCFPYCPVETEHADS